MWEQLNSLYLVVPGGRRASVERRTGIVRASGHRGHPSLSRRDRSHAQPRRGLALHAARPVHRAGHDDRVDARGRISARPASRASSGPTMSERRRTPSGSACCARARRSSRTAAPIRPTAAGADDRVPAAQRGVPAVGPVRRRSRSRSSLRAIAGLHGRDGERPSRAVRRPSARRAELRHRSTRSWQDHLARYVASARQQCDQIHLALFQTYISYPIETAIAI